MPCFKPETKQPDVDDDEVESGTHDEVEDDIGTAFWKDCSRRQYSTQRLAKASKRGTAEQELHFYTVSDNLS